MNEEKHWKMPDWIRMNMISKEGAFIMAKVFITLTGTKHYFGNTVIGESMSAGRLYDKSHRMTGCQMAVLLNMGGSCSVSTNPLTYTKDGGGKYRV